MGNKETALEYNRSKRLLLWNTVIYEIKEGGKRWEQWEWDWRRAQKCWKRGRERWAVCSTGCTVCTWSGFLKGLFPLHPADRHGAFRRPMGRGGTSHLKDLHPLAEWGCAWCSAWAVQGICALCTLGLPIPQPCNVHTCEYQRRRESPPSSAGAGSEVTDPVTDGSWRTDSF